MHKNLIVSLLFGFFFYPGFSQEKIMSAPEVFHTISSYDLLDYAAELSSEKYGGRLSGSPGY